MELNGMRPWKENREVMAFADTVGKPVIAGGDRHGLQPNATLNVTDAAGFAEFAAQVRRGLSEVLFAAHQFEPFALRMLQNAQDVMADHENHGAGGCDGAIAFSMSVMTVSRARPANFGARRPRRSHLFEAGLRALRHPGLRIDLFFLRHRRLRGYLRPRPH